MCKWRQNWFFHRREREINWTSTGQSTICRSIDNNYFALLLLTSRAIKGWNQIILKVFSRAQITQSFLVKHNFFPTREGNFFLFETLFSISFLRKQADSRLTLQPLGFHIRFFWIFISLAQNIVYLGQNLHSTHVRQYIVWGVSGPLKFYLIVWNNQFSLVP